MLWQPAVHAVGGYCALAVVVHGETVSLASDGNTMDVDVIKGKWKLLGARLKSQWAMLSDDDIGLAEGHRDYLVGRLQERYGWAKQRAETEVEHFEQELLSADKER